MSKEEAAGGAPELSRRDVMKVGGAAAATLGLGTTATHLGSFDASAADPELDEELVWSACWTGKMDCAASARKVGDRVVKMEGHPDEPRTGGGLCPKGQAQLAHLYDPYRVKAPLKRTNDKGQHGEWQEITWEQAYAEIGEDLQSKLEDDPRRVTFQVGRKKAPLWHYHGFTGAMKKRYGDGVQKQGHGALCSNSGYKTEEMTFGTHGVAESDNKNCDYLLAWGFNITQGGGSHLCQQTWPRQIADAKERGMKVVLLDPQRRNGGEYVDEWLPIEPGTDLAFFSAMNNVLVDKGYLDEEYLTRATNAPCLVDSNGHILRAEDAEDPAESAYWPRGELVFDSGAGEVVPHEEAESPALFGTFEVDGVEAKPAFQLYEEHIAQYDPEWAADITDIDAETIERIATEWGEHAKIGSTTMVDGREVPERPVATHGYHVAQCTEMGVPTTKAHFMTSMLVGAVDVVGSTRPRQARFDGPTGHRAGIYDLAHNPEQISDQPDGPNLGGSKYSPINSGGYSQTHVSLTNPEQYDLPYGPEDMAMIVQMANPVRAVPNIETVIESMSQMDTVVVVDPFMSETADVAGDYVLPAATADKLEGPTGGWTGYEDIGHVRFPLMDSMWKSRADAEIFIDLAKATDVEEEYVGNINAGLGLSGTDHAFDPSDGLPDDGNEFLRDGLDRWAQTQGHSLEWFEEGNVMTSEWSGGQLYGYLWGDRDEWGEYNPYAVKHEFYSETLVRIGDRVDEMGGVEEDEFPFVQDYTGYPTWRQPTMHESPDEYDMTLFSGKQIEHKQSRTADNRMLNEINPGAWARMHPETAAERGIEDGDDVVIESHNAMTGVTKQAEAEAMLVEGLKPGSVMVAHHQGNWSSPVSDKLDEGLSGNWLFHSGPGYIGFDTGQSFQIRVDVSPKGGET